MALIQTKLFQSLCLPLYGVLLFRIYIQEHSYQNLNFFVSKLLEYPLFPDLTAIKTISWQIIKSL